MIVTLKKEVQEKERQQLLSRLHEKGFALRGVQTHFAEYVVLTSGPEIDIREIGHIAGVQDVHVVHDAYQLVSRAWKAKPTSLSIPPQTIIASGALSIIGGPCSVESEESMRSIAQFLRSQGSTCMRGGAYKPRSSPYSFQGHGLEGLKMFARVAREEGLSVISEVVSASHIEAMYDYVDVFQVGTRNSQNFDLLHELGKIDKPVLLKRAMSGTLEELLQSAEYIFANGNEKIILCERGIRSFEKSYRNTLDINAIPALKTKSHLPVLVDPSHGVGVRAWVEAIALAAVAAGADGLLIEVHEHPEKALSDGQQTLNFQEFSSLVQKARAVKSVL